MTSFSRRARRAAVAAGLLAVVSTCVAGLASTAMASTAVNPNPQKIYPSVTYGKSDKGDAVRADVYSPQSANGPAPVVIIVHGGGWTSGDKSGESAYAGAMASEGFVTVNVNYTLSTSTSPGYPDQVQEVQQAIKWTIAHASQYGGDPTRIALVGFSAGAYLVAMAGQLDSTLPGHPIKAIVTLSAPFDFTLVQQMLQQRVAMCGYATSCPQDKQDPPQDTLAAFATMYDFLGCPSGKCSNSLLKSASPISHVSSSSPPFLIFNSSDELIPHSQATIMGSALQAASVPEQVVIVPGSQHGEAYLSEVDGTILKYLGARLSVPGIKVPENSTPAGSSGSSSTLKVLVVCCVVVVAGSLAVIGYAQRRRRPTEYRSGYR